MHSDTNNSEKLVFRLRMYNLEEADEDDVEMTTCMFLKENMDKLLTEMTLKGFPEITKVSFSKYPEIEYDLQTGEEKTTKDNWMIETDGVAL